VNIHEHQAKALLATYGIPLSQGVPIFKPEEDRQPALY
jgi:succinyl-CoA synthetase beta subunit